MEGENIIINNNEKNITDFFILNKFSVFIQKKITHNVKNKFK